MNLKEIKDAARRAFSDQQLQDTEGGVPDAVSFCVGFLAGVRHRQSEIDELRDTLEDFVLELKLLAWSPSALSACSDISSRFFSRIFNLEFNELLKSIFSIKSFITLAGIFAC